MAARRARSSARRDRESSTLVFSSNFETRESKECRGVAFGCRRRATAKRLPRGPMEKRLADVAAARRGYWRQSTGRGLVRWESAASHCRGQEFVSSAHSPVVGKVQ